MEPSRQARHNLPGLLTALVGRERDVAEVVERLETARLLTLVGAGGIGKTRLALSVGAEVVARYPAGVWLVGLASLADPATIPRAIAAALGVYEEPDRDLTATIADAVRSRRPLLVILDNCEHLIADVASIVDRLLETIRAYALERLDASGEAERVRQRHAEYFMSLAEEAGPRVRFISGRHWLSRLDTEHDNLRAALAWGAEAPGSPDLTPRIAGALWRYWYLRGQFTEGRQWLGRALDLVAEPSVRLTALVGASVLAFSQDDYAPARLHALEGVSRGRACDDQRIVAWALTVLGHAASRLGDVDRALAYCDEGLTLSRQVGDAEAIAHALTTYGNATERTGSYDRAEALYAECERWARVADHAWFLPLALHRLANMAALRDDVDRATALCSEALALIRQTGNSWLELPALEVVIRVAQRRADVEQVSATAHLVGTRYREFGNPGGIALAASPLAWVAHRRGDNLRAARLLGAADALMAVSGRVRLPCDQADHD